MATTKQTASPKKKSEGFQGVRGAFWIIVCCAVIAFILFWKFPQMYGVLSSRVV